MMIYKVKNWASSIMGPGRVVLYEVGNWVSSIKFARREVGFLITENGIKPAAKYTETSPRLATYPK